MIIDFGVPEIDELFGAYLPVLGGSAPDVQRDRIAELPGISTADDETISVCIVGADGTGKSVLALHLASRFAARYDAPVVYCSEDLGYDRAAQVFTNFGLDRPTGRASTLGIAATSPQARERVGISRVMPAEGAAIPQPGGGESGGQGTTRSGSPRMRGYQAGVVHFIDFRSKTTSDNWAAVLGYVGSLPRTDEPALVIVDSIDALQFVNAGVDRYGKKRTRWSRLDQLISLAGNRCHLVVISGEPPPGQRFDEQYAVDFVLHLHQREQAGYVARMLEVEKTRAQANVGGLHPFTFRSGHGTTTGYQENPDFPQVTLDGNPLAHVRVFHSTDYVYSKFMRHRYEGYVPGDGERVKFFGLDQLNELLPDENGLAGGMVTAIVGARQTMKGPLRSAFEAGCLGPAPATRGNVPAYRLAEQLQRSESRGERGEDLAAKYANYWRSTQQSWGQQLREGMVVHITTEDTDSWQVANRLARACFDGDEEAFRDRFELNGRPDKAALAWFESRIICRRLEIHAVSPAVLYSVIRDCVDAGLKRALGSSRPDMSVKDRREAGRVVVTIGDWAQIEERYPSVATDTKFLPLLLFDLKRQGVNTLITETRSDLGGAPSIYQSVSRLAQDADQAIYTWRIVGDSRLAISVAPQRSSENRAIVREVRADPEFAGRLRIRRSLERYHGFETGDPKPVKLYLRLLGQTPGQQAYAKEMATLFSELSEGEQTEGALVEATDEMEYDLLRDVVYLLGDTQLSHTQLLMLDEFWETEETLHSLEHDYLNVRPDEMPGRRFFPDERRREFSLAADLKRIFLPPKPASVAARAHRPDLAGLSLPGNLAKNNRVPYSWDFGFILARQDAWRRAYHRTLASLEPLFNRKEQDYRQPYYIRSLAELLRFAVRDEDGRYVADTDRRSKVTGPYSRQAEMDTIHKANAPALKNGKTLEHDLLGWRIFLEACCTVASESSDMRLKPFDVDLTATETLSALVLEIWMSELRRLLELALPLPAGSKEHSEEGVPPEWNEAASMLARLGLAPRGFMVRGEPVVPSLPRLINNPWSARALYLSLRLLAEVFDEEMLQAGPTGFDIAPRRPFPAAAVRHWYATAVRTAREDNSFAFSPARLPGCCSCRGDWHLAMAAGSRSVRLGYDALDKLSSIRANFDRLQLGVGLPTRDLPEPEYIRTALVTEPSLDVAPGLTYANLVSLGAAGDPRFQWLFRSSLEDYRFHSTPFRKWVFRVLRQWVKHRLSQPTNWENGFRVYDEYVLSRRPTLASDRSPRGYEGFVAEAEHVLRIFQRASLAE